MIKFKGLNQSKQFLRILKKKSLNTKYFTIYFEKNLSSVKKNDIKILNQTSKKLLKKEENFKKIENKFYILNEYKKIVQSYH